MRSRRLRRHRSRISRNGSALALELAPGTPAKDHPARRALVSSQDDEEEDDSPEESPSERLWRGFLLDLFLQFRDEIVLLVVGTVAAIVRAMGATVESGQTGLLFTCGRASKTLPPGFRPLVPFLQRVSKVPTRSRTLDLPAQRVVTFSGLVYHVDANLVYRIVDVRKALIEIDDVEKGMRQMLGLGVQEVVRASDREQLARPRTLDADLERNLAERLAPWGVQVERTGLTSITPSRQTLRITQIARVTGERRTMFTSLADDTGEGAALGLIGSRTRLMRRHLYLRAFERRSRRVRKLRRTLMQHGWMSVQIKQAAVRLRSRSTTGGKLRDESKDRNTAGANGVGPGQNPNGPGGPGVTSSPGGPGGHGKQAPPGMGPRRNSPPGNAPRRGSTRNAPPGSARRKLESHRRRR